MSNSLEEPDITVVSEKGQVVIPAPLRNKLKLKPHSKLLVYGVKDMIVLKKLAMPDVKREMESLWKEVDSRIAKYGELGEKDIVREIENRRKRRK